jgi:uncharacterized membrane protein YhaH (DUF805 family)
MSDLVELARQTLSWRGRADRRTLLMSIALLMLLGLAALPLIVAAYAFGRGPVGLAASAIAVPLGAAQMFFLFGSVVRRLHDRGKSGWWLLLFFGPHVALTALLSQLHDTNRQTIILAGGLLVDLPFLGWGIVEIFLLPSARGPNVHGPVPRDSREVLAAPAQG